MIYTSFYHVYIIQCFMDTFADQFWRLFEEFAIKFIEEKYSNYPEKITHITDAKADGGYDGIIIVDNGSSLEGLLYRILIEAKLRKISRKDLPLSDFSKTLIIAINTFANKVYIVTNLHYSAETVRRVNNFAIRTGLEIGLIDIFSITDELRKNTALYKDFPPEFIEELLNSEKNHNRVKQIINESDFLKLTPQVPSVIGDSRDKELKICTELIQTKSGVLQICGHQGFGKSTFISNLLQESNSLGFVSHLIDLQEISTSREFFIEILSIVWNTSKNEIYSFTEKDIFEITGYIDQKILPLHERTAILNILNQNIDDYNNKVDLWQSHLLQYLFIVYVPIINRRKYIIAFSNINVADLSVSNFLLKFVKKFAKENIVFILETRTIDYDFNWQQYCDNINQITSFLRKVTLEEWKKEDRQKYIEEKGLGLSPTVIDRIVTSCTGTPIIIDSFVDSMMRDKRLMLSVCSSRFDMRQLLKNQRFNEGLIRNAFDTYISYVCEGAKSLIALIGLFDGTINLKKAQLIYQKEDWQIAVEQLTDSLYFELSNANIRIKHLLYLEPVQNYNYISKYNLYQIVEKAFQHIDSLILDEHSRILKRLQLAIQIGDVQIMCKLWNKVASGLLDYEEYGSSKKILLQAYELIYNYISEIEQFELIIMLAQAYIGLNLYSDASLQRFLARGEMLSNLNISGKIRPKFLKCKKKFYYVKSKYLLAKGDYRQLLTLTHRLPWENGMDNEIDGHIHNYRSLAIKHIYGIDACLLSLKRGISKYPDCWYLSYSYYDHLMAKYATSDPSKALACLKKAEVYQDRFSLEVNLHYQYNIATLLFYMDETSQAKDICMEVCIQAFNNTIPVEEGRCYNLLGQLAWNDNYLDDALEKFKLSFNIQKSTQHATHIWTPLVNISVVYLEKKESENALLYASHALKYIMDICLEEIKLYNSKTGFASKPYVALLILANTIYQIDPHNSMLQKIMGIGSGCLEHDYTNYIKNNILEKYLHGTHFYRNGRFMIRS